MKLKKVLQKKRAGMVEADNRLISTRE